MRSPFNAQRIKNMSYYQNQSGIALITAVLIVALVTVAASAMATRQILDIRRTENVIHSDQAYAYALAAEQLVGRVLVDFDKDKNVDHMGEDWAKVAQVPIPMRGGVVTASIQDASGAFPINSVVDEAGVRRDTFYVALQSLIDKVLADSFAPELPAAIMDWVDANQDVTPGGAEDLDYLNKPFPYRAANHPISSVSELRLLNGMLPDDYIKLVPRDGRAPFINALPWDATININTAPKEVIMCLSDKITAEMADEIIAARDEAIQKGEAPYKDIGKFVEQIADSITFDGATPQEIAKNRTDFIEALKKMQIDVKSQYFEVTTLAKVGRTTVQLHSLLKRDNNQIIVMRRGIGVD